MRARAIGLLALLYLSVFAPVEATPKQTFVTTDCIAVRIEPRAITITCADGNFYVRRLDWHRWGPYRAGGHGVFHRNDCDPSCAQGTFHVRRGHIVLLRRTWCGDIHRFAFARARITFARPFLGRTVYRATLGDHGCPWT